VTFTSAYFFRYDIGSEGICVYFIVGLVDPGSESLLRESFTCTLQLTSSVRTYKYVSLFGYEIMISILKETCDCMKLGPAVV
jgi:hypothetical protein